MTEKLNAAAFAEYAKERQKKIEQASDTVNESFPVNEFAAKLHPNRQYLKIESVRELEPGTNCYRLVPDPGRGTAECAPFIAGQYVNVYLDIGGMKVNRPYSISSSPAQAKEGFYELTIRRVQDGLVSQFILDNWKEGGDAEISGPKGQFTYSPLRDAETVIGLAGGSGITPFLSFARAIADGYEDFRLILLDGSRTEKDILFREELDALQEKSDRIRVVHVLSDEEREGYEHGFLSADLIRKYAPADAPYSIFICGPQVMYRYLDTELAKLELPRKYIRHELFGEIYDPSAMDDYPVPEMPEVKITVSIQDRTRTVTGSVGDSVLRTLEKNGIAVPTGCRGGECGMCHSMLLSGKVYVPEEVDGRRLADFKFGGIHPCVCFPLSDLEIEVPAAK